MVNKIKKYYSLLSTLFILNVANAQMVFLEPPENFNPTLEVATCYIMHKDKVLFLKRTTTSTWGHTWGLPGGKIEENQTPLETMLREVFEETAIDLSQEEISFLGKVYVKDPKKDFIYYMFQCKILSKPKEISLAQDEHLEYIWLNPQEAVTKLPLVPGEDECIHLVYENLFCTTNL